MTVIRPNSISGVTSITALANEINVFKHDGVLAGLQLNGVNHHTSSGVSTFHTLNVLGNVSVGGTLTYQDVTNVDSLGIGTFRTGINVSGGQLDVGSNIKLGNAGVITATSFVGSGSGLTGLNSDLVNDTSPQLGGNLDTNSHHIHFDNLHAIRWEAGNTPMNFQMYHESGYGMSLQNGNSAFYIQNATGNDNNIFIRAKSGENSIKAIANGAVELYHSGNKQLETLSDGVKITGNRLNITDTGSVDLYLSADTDNSDESHVPRLHFVQDGSATRLIIGSEGSAGTAFSNSVGNSPYLQTLGSLPLVVATNSVGRWQFTSGGHFFPMANNSYDIGSSSYRARNIYTNDLNLSNKGSTNCVDNTWGDYTIQEGENDLFLINNRSGKKYKFNLTEVS